MKTAIIKRSESITTFIETTYRDSIQVFDVGKASLKKIVAELAKGGSEKVGIDGTLDTKSKEYLRKRVSGCQDVNILELETYAEAEFRKSDAFLLAKIVNGQTSLRVVIKS